MSLAGREGLRAIRELIVPSGGRRQRLVAYQGCELTRAEHDPVGHALLSWTEAELDDVKAAEALIAHGAANVPMRVVGIDVSRVRLGRGRILPVDWSNFFPCCSVADLW
jgi:hypothetical protein